jgi:hypothetical protein
MKMEFFLTDFLKICKYHIKWKSFLWEPSCSMLTNGRTDLTDLIVAFFAILRERQKPSHVSDLPPTRTVWCVRTAKTVHQQTQMECDFISALNPRLFDNRGKRKEWWRQLKDAVRDIDVSDKGLLLSVGAAEFRLAHCSLSRLIVLNPVLVPPFISRAAPHHTAWETSISERRKYGREMDGQI